MMPTVSVQLVSFGLSCCSPVSVITTFRSHDLSQLGVGLAVPRNAAPQVWHSSEPAVEGIFPLELTWFLTPFPQNSWMTV